MKGVLPVGLLCSLVAFCLASGSEAQDVSSVGDVKESRVVSSFLPESPSSTYLLAFPVDDAKSNDNSEEVHAGGGGATTTAETVTEEPAPAEKEEKADEQVVTVVLSDSDPKEDDKNEVMVPLQDLQPKEETKFFPPLPSHRFPPFTPFRSKPTYRERKFPFVPPFQKFRPVRNFLQSLRKEPPTNKIPPVSFLGAASLLRRALSSKLRMLNDIYQPPKIDKKFVLLPGSIPHETPSSLPRSPVPIILPPPSLPRPLMPVVLPPPPEPVFRIFPFRRSFMSDAPPFMMPPLPQHSSLLLPPVMHPYPIAPTPFILPPSPYSIPTGRVLQSLNPSPMPMYDLPLVPLYRFLPSPLMRPHMPFYDPPALLPQRLSFPSPLQSRVPIYDQPSFIFHRFSSPPPKPPMSMYDSPSFPARHLPSLPPKPSMSMYDPPPFPNYNPSSRPPLIEHSQEMVISEPINVPSYEPPYMLQNLEHKYPPSKKGFEEEEEVVFIPLEGETTNPEEPSFLYYEFDKPQDEVAAPKKRTLLDLLPPRGGNVHRVIHKTRIITSYKPDLTDMSSNHLEASPSTFHKPAFRITDV